MYLVYACVFFQEGYCQLAELLLKSFAFTNPISSDIHFLVLCNEKFKSRIDSLLDTLFINGKSWIMEFETIPTAAMARLEIFRYPDIKKYEKLLYVDCDVLITGDMRDLFCLPLKDKLYGLKEGSTREEMWGSKLFRQTNPNTDGICSGVLLFQPSLKIETLFENVKKHMNHFENKDRLPCYDQPFLIYHALQLNVLDGNLLEFIVENNPKQVGNQIVSHFPLWPGHYECKIHNILAFLKKMVKSVHPVNETLHAQWNKMYLQGKCYETQNGVLLHFHDGYMNDTPFSFCHRHLIKIEVDSRTTFIRFDSEYKKCIIFETHERSVYFFKMESALLTKTPQTIFYLCSLGGSMADWFAAHLEKYGTVHHVHSRTPPDTLEFVNNGHFSGTPVPPDELSNYKIIVLQVDPVMTIIESFQDVYHLIALGCPECPDLLDVIEQKKDLYDIKGFYNSYQKCKLPIHWTSVRALLENDYDILTKLNIAAPSKPPSFQCPYEIQEVRALNCIEQYQKWNNSNASDKVACRRNYFKACDVALRRASDIPSLTLLKPQQCVGIERILLTHDVKALKKFINCINYPFSVQIIDSDEDSCCFSVTVQDIQWLQNHDFVSSILVENWIGGPSPKVIPIPIGICSRTLSTLENYQRKEWKPTPFDQKKNRVSITFSQSLHQRNPGQVTSSGFLPERENALEKLKSNSIVDILEPMSFVDYLKHYNEYKFTVSPLGNGVDCHRTWESLLFGTIPIVKKGPLDYLYACYDYPIVIVNDWNEIHAENLEKWSKQFQQKIDRFASFTRKSILAGVSHTKGDRFAFMPKAEDCFFFCMICVTVEKNCYHNFCRQKDKLQELALFHAITPDTNHFVKSKHVLQDKTSTIKQKAQCLSYQAIFDYFQSSNHEYLVILEDHVTISDNFGARVRNDGPSHVEKVGALQLGPSATLYNKSGVAKMRNRTGTMQMRIHSLTTVPETLTSMNKSINLANFLYGNISKGDYLFCMICLTNVPERFDNFWKQKEKIPNLLLYDAITPKDNNFEYRCSLVNFHYNLTTQKGRKALWLSNLDVFQTFLHLDYKYLVVLQDDAIAPENLEGILNEHYVRHPEFLSLGGVRLGQYASCNLYNKHCTRNILEAVKVYPIDRGLDHYISNVATGYMQWLPFLLKWELSNLPKTITTVNPVTSEKSMRKYYDTLY